MGGVFSSLFHLSTDDNPLHNFCTANCPYNYKKAEARGELYEFKHKSSLPSAVIEVIKPIFKEGGGRESEGSTADTA